MPRELCDLVKDFLGKAGLSSGMPDQVMQPLKRARVIRRGRTPRFLSLQIWDSEIALEQWELHLEEVETRLEPGRF